MILEIYGSPTFISDTINCFRIYAFFCYYATVLRPIEITIYNNTTLRNRVFVKINQNKTVIADYVNLESIKMKS